MSNVLYAGGSCTYTVYALCVEVVPRIWNFARKSFNDFSRYTPATDDNLKQQNHI